MFKRIIRALRKPIILQLNTITPNDKYIREEEEKLSERLNRKVILVDVKVSRF